FLCIFKLPLLFVPFVSLVHRPLVHFRLPVYLTGFSLLQHFTLALLVHHTYTHPDSFTLALGEFISHPFTSTSTHARFRYRNCNRYSLSYSLPYSLVLFFSPALIPHTSRTYHFSLHIKCPAFWPIPRNEY